MELEFHLINDKKIAEIHSADKVIHSVDAGLDLLGDLYYQEVDVMMIHESGITPEFFDLKTGVAGELLQKFANYRMRLIITGELSKYPGKRLAEFIFESNKGTQVNFVNTRDEALQLLAKN